MPSGSDYPSTSAATFDNLATYVASRTHKTFSWIAEEVRLRQKVCQREKEYATTSSGMKYCT